MFARMGERARCLEDLGELISAVATEAKAGDHVLIMSNGGFGGIQAKLLERLQSVAAA